MLVTTENYEQALRYLDHQTLIAVDTETTGLYPYKNRHGNPDRVVGIVCCANGQSYYFPFRHKLGDNLAETAMQPLLRLLEYRRSNLVFHNAKFDLHMLANEGFQPPTTMPDEHGQHMLDTQVAAHFLNENEPSFKLKDLAKKYVDPHAAEPEEQLMALLKSKDLDKAGMHRLPAEQVEPYAAQDGIITEKLMQAQQTWLQNWRLHDLFLQQCLYQLVVWRMERRGILVNEDLCYEYMRDSKDETEALRQHIIEMAGYDINPASYAQLKGWLGLESTAKDILLDIAEESEAARTLLEWRQLSKAESTYYQPYINWMDRDHIVHPNYRVTGTVTGRMSCADPNLQQIPRLNNGRYRVKDVFVPRPGYLLFSADYSQAEYRVAAHYAQERTMLQAFMDGADLHERTAEEMGIDRSFAKTLNFAVLYGMGAKSLAKRRGISEDEAKAYLQRFYATYPNLRQLMLAYAQRARQNGQTIIDAQGVPHEQGFIRLFTGRVRHFNRLEMNKHTGKPEIPFHKAGNSLIQGSVAEITRIAMTKVDYDPLMRDLDVHMLLQVHDDIVGEVPIHHVDRAMTRLKDLGEDTPFSPPGMRLDVKVGTNLGNGMHKWEPKGARQYVA